MRSRNSRALDGGHNRPPHVRLPSDGADSQASPVSEPEEDEMLECGLKRSAFNSGYYARFFREERKLGAGGVGGVYLTHHVLAHVRLGTYAVKKIPGAWLASASS